jgi:hypothetical protein
VVIRYNTFVDNEGPSNVQLSYGATGNQIYRNIFVQPEPGQSNVTVADLNGTGNVVDDNVGWLSRAVMDVAVGLLDGGGNFMANPGFINGVNDFQPTNPAVAGYGA